MPQILDQPCDFYLSVVGRSVVHVGRRSLLKLVLLELALSALALVGRTTQDIIHQDLKARYPTLADWQLVETYQGASFMTQPSVEPYGGCMLVLKVSWCGI